MSAQSVVQISPQNVAGDLAASLHRLGSHLPVRHEDLQLLDEAWRTAGVNM